MVDIIGRHWWAVGLRGLAAILFGLLALLLPVHTLVALVALFGAYALVDGIFTLVATMRAVTRHRTWGLLLLEGIAGIAAGLLTFAWPGITALMLLYVIAAWAIVTGAMEVAAAFTVRGEAAPAWLIGLSGIASVIFGALLILFPGAGALAVVSLIGVYALVFGVLVLGLAYRLWQAQRDLTGNDVGSHSASHREGLRQLR